MKKYFRSQEKKKTKNIFKSFHSYLNEEELPASAFEIFFMGREYYYVNIYDDYDHNCDCEYCSHVRYTLSEVEEYINTHNKTSKIHLSEIFFQKTFK